MTAFNLLHYICYIFHGHCFLVNILRYIVIASVYISCTKLYEMKSKTETKIQTKYQLFVVLFIIILLSYFYPAEFRNQILKIQNCSCR